MALQAQRQLLDELMGRARDIDPSEMDNSIPEWCEPKICRFFLVKFCPNQLFTNTKADMGPCQKLHDEFIKSSYQERASSDEKATFEEEFVRFCQQTLNDVERRIKRAKQRLASSQTDKSDDSNMMISEEIQEKINEISNQVETMLEKIEELGCEGKVEEAQSMMKQVEKLKDERATLKRDSMPMHWIQQRAEIGAAQEKQMEVCDVCGAFLIVNDVQQRVDDHLMGKQHVGYGKLKTALDEILEKRKTERNERGGRFDRRSRSRSRDRNDRYRDRREGGYGGGGSRRRDRDSRDRDRRRSRSRERDRDRGDKGDRRRDRDRRDKNRDKRD